MEVECKECHRKFTDRINDYPMNVYLHKEEAVCADCLMGMGVLPPHDKSSHLRLLTDSVLYTMRPF
jgi:hypothetical protein